MTKRLQVYEGDGLLVTFDPNVCIHSAVCLRSLPGVFDVSRRKWIELEAASADEIVAAVAKCPSGALKAIRAGVAEQAGAAPVVPQVEVGVRPNGPILVRGAVRVTRENGEVVLRESCSLCRCGATGTAPFCDGSHNRINFKSPS
ncbi:MAG: (4Fe-4S)-binding protein [Gemmatimonadales bacterium]